MTFGRYQSGKDLPDLLAAVPRWYPGAWGPPAFTVSLASAAMTAFTAWYLFRNELVRAMFRFPPPFDSLIVVGIALILAGMILWRTSLRPGGLWPRIWALFLVVYCGAVTLWTLYVRITGRGDQPLLHALAAVGALAALTLIPRLFRVHPFSIWVRHAAPAALAFVLLFCFPLIFWSESTVVAKERQLLDAKITGLEKAYRDIYSIVHAVPVKASPFSFENVAPLKLEDVNFVQYLPDEADWKALGLLQRQKPDLRSQDRMRMAMSGLLRVIAEGAANPDGPRLSESPLHAEGVSENNDTRWRENRHFSGEAKAAVDYYHELGRMFREFDTAGRVSPFRGDYGSSQSDLARSMKERSDSTGQLWISAVFMGQKDPADPQRLTLSRVGDSKYILGDLGRWKNLSWSEAESLLKQPGCLHDAQELQRYETEQVPDPDHPGQFKEEQVLRHYDRIECYAYRPGQEGESAAVLAELHLTYRKEWHSVRSSSTPHVVLLFDVPPKAVRYTEVLMQALADCAYEKYGVKPQNRAGGNPTQGFSASSRFTAIPGEIRRRQDVVTIAVRVY